VKAGWVVARLEVTQRKGNVSGMHLKGTAKRYAGQIRVDKLFLYYLARDCSGLEIAHRRQLSLKNLILLGVAGDLCARSLQNLQAR
jgi:hypothetical protein